MVEWRRCRRCNAALASDHTGYRLLAVFQPSTGRASASRVRSTLAKCLPAASDKTRLS